MPRFENEGFDPRKNSDLDRTVPEDENFYGDVPIDLNFNSRRREERGVNPCDIDLEPPRRRNTPERPRTDERPRTQERRPVPDERRSNKVKKKKKQKKAKITAIVAALLAIVIIITGSLGATAVSAINKFDYDEKLTNQYVDAGTLMHDENIKNILLLGVDARPTDKTAASRSDTMMLVSIDKVHNCVKMVSFLRDTWVYLPDVDHSQRLNAACSYGGYQGVVNAIEYNFGVAIDGYAVVDFEMFKVMVDSLGGVEITVTAEEAKEVTGHPRRYGDVVLDEGTYKLTGEQALAYCRIRKIDTDWMRTKRQRTVMSAILSGAKSNPVKLLSMAKSVAPYIETNLSKSELMSIGSSAVSCLGSMHQARVPFDDTWYYDNINGNSVIVANADMNKEKLVDYIYNKTSDELTALEAEDK